MASDILFHQALWEKVQIASIPFVFVAIVYRFFFGVWNIDKYYFPETIGTHWEVLRFWNLRNLKIDKNIEEKRRQKYKDLPELKSTTLDYLYYLYISTGIVYYYYDILHKVYYVGIANFTFCNYTMVFHHFTTIFSYKFHGSVYYYSWYIMFPSAYHTIMVACPSFYWNYVIYGISLFLFWASNMYFETMRSTLIHKYLFFCVPLLGSSLFMIVAGKCDW